MGMQDRQERLERILAFVRDETRTGPTVYRRAVVASAPLPDDVTADTRIYYGQYDKRHEGFLRTMATLTDGAFRSGMIARLVLRDCWTAGVAPTLRQFADEWTRASAAHVRPRPEAAYLSDRRRGEAGSDWTQVRAERAAEALALIATLVAEHDTGAAGTPGSPGGVGDAGTPGTAGRSRD